jgi:hypothetical protein
MSELNGDSSYYQETDENRAFRQAFEERIVKQDDDLDFIEKGLGNLQNIATDMGAEVNKQDILLDQIEEQVIAGILLFLNVSNIDNVAVRAYGLMSANVFTVSVCSCSSDGGAMVADGQGHHIC